MYVQFTAVGYCCAHFTKGDNAIAYRTHISSHVWIVKKAWLCYICSYNDGFHTNASKGFEIRIYVVD